MRWYGRPEGHSHQLRVAPRLASCEKSDHPDQVRLRNYLDDTRSLLAESRIDGPRALRLDVGCQVDGISLIWRTSTTMRTRSLIT